ncbi:AAA family ATPase [Jatrophihabitans sp.]|uniref:AAA family ATPase n=1 Tax=Jatrophihabitans sp. TaxID=1932789 RepID=UPI002CEEEC12|nr:SMC family ATPase [Jatrophihabitans sp.]
MRPVLLEMTGFASFRERTEIRFNDTDYFVLVGPTGAGKSTVIDALTFALYGTVARWDNENLVSPALAPTANRGVVRLIFDVSGSRYSVVRELRRSGGKNSSVGIKSSRLERFADPNATGAGQDDTGGGQDDTEVLAADSEVTGAVEKLLGLTFKHFCTCVALPQGDFAEFLHVKAGERQRILTKLLGYEKYEQIARSAGAEATALQQRAETLEAQLGQYADATEEAVADLAGRADDLTELSESVRAMLPRLDEATRAHLAADGKVTTLTGEIDALTSVRRPAGIAELAATQLEAEEQLAVCEAAFTAADAADRAARRALSEAPERAKLEHVRRAWAELAAAEAELPSLVETARSTAEKNEQVCTDLDKVNQALPGLRLEVDKACKRETEAKENAARVQGERDLLATLTEPLDTVDAGEAHAAAIARLAEADSTLAQAESELAGARTRLSGSRQIAVLAGAISRADDLAQVLTEDLDAAGERAEATQGLVEAEAAHRAARRELTEAEDAVRTAEQAELALTLRARLSVGQPCPVCEQDVHAVPEHAELAQVEAARQRLDTAATRHTTAQRELATAQRRADHASANHGQALRRAGQLRADLAGDWEALPSTVPPLAPTMPIAQPITADADDDTIRRLLGEVRKASGQLHEADNAEQELGRACQLCEEQAAGARAAVRAARDELRSTEQAVRQAQAGLRSARERVLALNPPAIDDEDVRAAWTHLSSWATAQERERAEQLPRLQTESDAAAGDADEQRKKLRDAEATVAALQRAATETARAAQRAESELTACHKRRDDLTASLADGMTDAQAVAELDRVAKLEDAVSEAEGRLETARVRRDQAAQIRREVQADIAAARRQLASARDPLVRLGAPLNDSDDVATGWTELLGWAAQQATHRQQQLAEARALTEQRAANLRDSEQELCDLLAEHAVQMELATHTLRDAAPVAVASALADARSQQQRMAERVEQVAGLRAGIRDAIEQSRVARLLANLMRADAFPRWLVASVLDVLVADASEMLDELSGGQFALTHADGDFYIIDHNEADASRPVKTLSGGETFQAALALALALSDRMSSLAADGAVRLESIFLDEGFGTLDEASLGTVADTLDNLASSGSRMVGIITHVGALAERVPVRFAVRRDSAGSHITRESA